MNNNQLPIYRFETNIPAQVTFPWGDFREVETKFGLSNVSKMDVWNGTEWENFNLFANDYLHACLLTFGELKGKNITITRKEEGKSKFFVAESDGIEVDSREVEVEQKEAPPSQQAPPPNSQAPPAQQPPAQQNNQPPSRRQDTSTTMPQLVTSLRACIQEVSDQMGDIFEASEDFRTLGVSIFIECNRKGIACVGTKSETKQAPPKEQKEAPPAQQQAPPAQQQAPPPEPHPESTGDDDLPF